MAAGHLYIGTSGFAFKEWKGNFYPEGVTDKQMLSYYSSVLGSVEINYTFRRMPSESTLESWRSQATEGFLFTLKAPQRITHSRRLKDVRDDVDEFVRRARRLEDRLGTILFQLPPNMKYDRDRLERFLDDLPQGVRFAMEFRHESWDDPEVKVSLAGREVAFCGADTQAKPLKGVPAADGHAYLRLRKEEYSDEELDHWGKQIAETMESGRDVFCYLKHEGGGIGPQYAIRIKESAREHGAVK